MSQRGRIQALANEYRKRQTEALKCYRPTSIQSTFHSSQASERIVRGGKRSGKTISASAEFASAVTGIDIIGPDGEPIPRKYPKHDMLCWVVGWDLAHIGQTIHRVLFEPGYFRVLPDEKSPGSYRALNPANPEDLERISESAPAGPLIPERLIDTKSWSWENRAEKIFKSVEVHHPWGKAKICAYPSTSLQPKQGDAVDLIWIDEDIRYSEHVAEWQDRLADKKGRLIWSAWPHGTNDALIEMSERAQEQSGEDNPDVEEVILRFSDNPFIDEEEKRKSIGRMRTDEDRRSRDFGEFLLDTIAIYNFVPIKHAIQKIHSDDPRESILKGDEFNKYYTRNGEFPRTWTRYLSIDPSHTRTAVLFGVVPPPKWEGIDVGKTLIIEDELVMKKASALELATAVRDKIGDRMYEAFVMDFNMGRQTRVGASAGHTVMMLYENAFHEKGVKSRTTGSSFIPGNNNITNRINEVRTMLAPNAEGRIALRLCEDKTYNTQREFGTYRKKMIMGAILDEPANARVHDCMAALEYMVSYVYNCEEPYVDPIAAGNAGSSAYRRAKKLLNRWAHKHNESEFCHLGPGSGSYVP